MPEESHMMRQKITILPESPLKIISKDAKISYGKPTKSSKIELSEFKKALLEEVDSFLDWFKDDSKRPSDYVYTAKHINNGFCGDFAHAIWEHFNRSDAIQATDDEELGGREYTHTFICFEERYYDAECVDGVDDWTQLPIFLDDNRAPQW